jgi:hypothetical protein
MSAPIDAIGRSPRAAFAAFLALHFLVWTLLPTLLYANLPLDLIEALTYGREWQLGYDKLPPLPWWLVELMYRLLGTDAAYYALAQIAVIVAFAAVFMTALPLVGARRALIAILIIDGFHYFQFTAVKFNHDVIQSPLGAGWLRAHGSGVEAMGIGSCSGSPSGSRSGQNISSPCWPPRLRCSCCSTRTPAAPCGGRARGSRRRSLSSSWRRISSGWRRTISCPLPMRTCGPLRPVA